MVKHMSNQINGIESENPIKTNLKGKVLAVTSKDSDKYLCKDAFEQLLNFYQTEILRGNKHLNWLAMNERTTEGINYLKEKKVIETKEEEKVVKKNIEKPHKINQTEVEMLEELQKKFNGKL